MNRTLELLYNQDLQMREQYSESDDTISISTINAKNLYRRNIVKTMITNDELLDAKDYYHAACIFQNGESANDAKTAHELATKSLELGLEAAKWLYAATLDKFLYKTTGKQKFGTQYAKHSKNTPWVLVPVDPETTDLMRAEYNIQNLEQLNAKVVQLNRKQK